MDELVELSGFHRKSVLRLLRQQPADHGGPPACADAGHDSAEVGRSRRHGPEEVQLLEMLWEASDHLCGKRLAAVLPTLMTALERHGHWQVDPDLRKSCYRSARRRSIDYWRRPFLRRVVNIAVAVHASSSGYGGAPRCALMASGRLVSTTAGRMWSRAGLRWTWWTTAAGAWRARSYKLLFSPMWRAAGVNVCLYPAEMGCWFALHCRSCRP